jgi:hypothetical protein
MNTLPHTACCHDCICRAVRQAGVAVRVVSNPKNGVTEKRRHEELLAEYMRLADEQDSHLKGAL